MAKKFLIIFLTDVIAIISLAVKKTLILLRLKGREKTLRVLVYHSVSESSFFKDPGENNVELRAFRLHMSILTKTPKKIASLDEGINSLKSGKLLCDSIAVTFDDGIGDVYTDALRILESFRIPAAFFIVYEYADRGGESLISADGVRRRFMSWSEVYSLIEKGYEIGSHSYSHRRLSGLEGEELVKEIGYAKKKFEEKGIRIRYFSYPYGFYGDFSERTEEAVKLAGYKGAFINVMGENRAGDNLYRLKRTRVSWRDNPIQFKMKINGAYDWVDSLKYRIRQ